MCMNHDAPDTAALLHGAVAILRERAEATWRQREQQAQENQRQAQPWAGDPQ